MHTQGSRPGPGTRVLGQRFSRRSARAGFPGLSHQLSPGPGPVPVARRRRQGHGPSGPAIRARFRRARFRRPGRRRQCRPGQATVNVTVIMIARAEPAAARALPVS